MECGGRVWNDDHFYFDHFFSPLGKWFTNQVSCLTLLYHLLSYLFTQISSALPQTTIILTINPWNRGTVFVRKKNMLKSTNHLNQMVPSTIRSVRREKVHQIASTYWNLYIMYQMVKFTCAGCTLSFFSSMEKSENKFR